MDKAHKMVDKEIAEMEKEFNKIYNQAKKELNMELKNGVDWNGVNAAKTRTKRLIAAKKSRRLSKMIHKMARVIQGRNRTALNIIDDRLINIFSVNYNWAGWQMERNSGYDTRFKMYSEEAVRELLKETTPVFTKMAYLGAKDVNKIQSDLRRQLTLGIMQGNSIEKLAEKIDKVTDKNNHGSVRIARTESGRIQNSGRLKAFEYGERQGLNLKKEWISTIDKRTRDTHKRLQGETISLDDTFSNGLKYPGDPNGSARETIRCRCTMISEFVGIKKGANELKLDEKIKNMSYEEWGRNHG